MTIMITTVVMALFGYLAGLLAGWATMRMRPRGE
jgi:hypothetical protein